MLPKLSIVSKLSLLVASAVAITAFSVNEAYLFGGSKILLEDALGDLNQQVDFFSYPLDLRIDQLKDDVQFMSHLQAMQAATRSGAQQAEVENIFYEMLRTTDYYRHITLVSAVGGIRPVLRMEQSNGQITHAPHSRFAEEPLPLEPIEAALARAPDEVTISAPHLERRDGKIVMPPALIIETMIPIHDAQKRAVGLLMVEVDFSAVLKSILQQFSGSETLYITDEAGDFLIHPDASRLYGGELGHDARLQRAYPSVLSVMAKKRQEKITLLPDDLDNGNVIAFKKYHYDTLHPEHYLGIAVETPYRAIISQINDVAAKGFLFTSIVALAAMACGMALLRFLLRPLGRIADMVARYRGGEKHIALPVDSPDEIGVLAREFKTMMSQKDNEDWVKETLVSTTKRLLGFKNLELFANALMEAAATAVGAQFGVLYIGGEYARMGAERDAHIVSFLGAYGYAAHQGVATAFRLGEGLVGQCAASRTRMLVADIPHDYLHVVSALGDAPPRQILLLPVLFENRLAGVMELASLGGFSAIHLTLLEQLCFNAGVIINGISASQRTEELLEEARMTAEELQRSEEELKTQQEELQASNEEMEEKTKALEEQNAQIRSQSEELTESSRLIEEKAAELERANTYKSEFLANMSHELRTPLNSLLILSRSLSANEEGNLTPEQMEEAGVIHSGGLELLGLINDILDLSKVEAGKITLLREDVPLDGIIKRMEQQFLPVAGQAGIAFHIRLENGLPAMLHTDVQRVEQILKNLLSNAFKFTQAGSVTLEAKCLDNHLAFAVIDTGIGIEENKFRDIFEAFQQEDGSTCRHYGGTGLGLTIARKFAHMLEGEIRVESVKGMGSRFMLLLPLAHEAAGELPARDYRVSPPAPVDADAPFQITPGLFVADDRNHIAGKDKVLLIVEDDRDFALTLVKIAKKHGYKCLVAGQGKDGLLLAAQHPITAIILDLKLPDMDGLSMLDQLKHDIKTRHIPVHVISAYGAQAKAAPLRKGAIGYLGKPITQEDIEGVFSKIEEMRKDKVRKLLVVEDDKKTQAAIRSLLKDSGIDITMAATGGAGLEHMRGEKFDCVILDLRLPDMTGLQWLEQVEKQNGSSPPLIIYTAQDVTEEDHRQLNSYTGSIVIKGAHSAERLLDEVTLFLHSVESLLPAQQQAIIRMQHDPDKALHGRTVLLVDDDLRNTFALTRLLKKHGLSVVIADNGQMALDKLKEEKAIELVIMDIMMPVMDGYQAMREIRAHAPWRQLPIIALTARAMPEEQEKCIAAGANDYLTKPVDIDRLLALLRVWLFTQEKVA